MNINLNSTERISIEKPDLKGWSHCSCNDPTCNRMFFQKSTLLHVLKPYLEKWKDLPLDLDLMSFHNINTGFMTLVLTISQTGDIQESELKKAIETKR